jgi:peptide/nickel transport system substrate-binding protein
MKHKILKRILAGVLTSLLAISLVACQNTETENTGNESKVALTETAAEGEKIVNIGVTDSLSSVNPLLMDASEILKYTLALEFLPLVELNGDLEFEGMLASSITTSDNLNFTVAIDPNATWSDGTAVTAADVEFTLLKLSSPELANVSMALYAIEGIGEDGFTESGATSISGVQVVDDKTIVITTKYEMALTTFQNTYGRYILTVPKHILETVAIDQLASYEWFQNPDVVSGPYRITEYDLQHFVSYEANSAYWKGEPKIQKLNFKIMDSPQLLTSLQAGEIDFIQQTTGNILQEDYEAVEALDGVQVNYGAPVTNQSIFFNTTAVSDVRIRQAIFYGLDRETLISGFLGGKGEVVDGFLSSASPFFSEDLAVTSYDPEKAKELLAEAVADGFDATVPLQFYVNSGDSTFVLAADYIAAKLAEIGLQMQVNTVDLSTLLTKAGSKEYDLLAIQYTYAPVDPYPDINWLLSADGWTGYFNQNIADELTKTQLTSDITKIRASYQAINQVVQQDVPMISAYVIQAQGVVSERLLNATPDVYGSFINIHEWDVKE